MEARQVQSGSGYTLVCVMMRTVLVSCSAHSTPGQHSIFTARSTHTPSFQARSRSSSSSSITVFAGYVAVCRRKTRDVEQQQAKALSRMTGVALQALENMRTVRYVWSKHTRINRHTHKHTSIRPVSNFRMCVCVHKRMLQYRAYMQSANACACVCVCSSFAGEPLERERFQVEVKQSYQAGLVFTNTKVSVTLSFVRAKQMHTVAHSRPAQM